MGRLSHDNFLVKGFHVKIWNEIKSKTLFLASIEETFWLAGGLNAAEEV